MCEKLGTRERVEDVTKLTRVQLGARDEWEHKLGTREISLIIPTEV